MTYVSIWTGGPIPLKWQKRIAANAHRVGGLVLFTDQLVSLPEVEVRDVWEVVEDIMRDPEWSVWFVRFMAHHWPSERFGEEIALSDFLRLFLALFIKNMVYVDCDVKLYTKVPADTRLMFAEYHGPRIDHCLFAVNGQTEQVADILRELCDQPQITRRSLYSVVNHQENVGAISQRIFRHK